MKSLGARLIFLYRVVGLITRLHAYSVIAMGEMIIGVGCTIGPILGGTMFAQAGPSSFMLSYHCRAFAL